MNKKHLQNEKSMERNKENVNSKTKKIINFRKSEKYWMYRNLNKEEGKKKCGIQIQGNRKILN